MKRWSIFGASKAQQAKPELPHATPPGSFEWTAMFKVRKRAGDGGKQARVESDEPTSVS